MKSVTPAKDLSISRDILSYILFPIIVASRVGASLGVKIIVDSPCAFILFAAVDSSGVVVLTLDTNSFSKAFILVGKL